MMVSSFWKISSEARPEAYPWKSAETAALTKGCAGGAVAAATSKKAPQAVAVKDSEPSEVLSAHRPCLAAVEQNRPDQSLVNATLDLTRNL